MTTTHTARALLLAALALTGACRGGSPSEAVPDVTRDARAPLQTEKLRYAFDGARPARADLALAFAYTNPGPDTIYVVTCGTRVLPVLQKKQGSDWVNARTIVTPPCLTVIPIAPHATRADTLPVCYPTAPTTSSCEPWRAGAVNGTYRLWVAGAHLHYDGAAGGPSVPDSLRVSNEFVLELK